MKVSVNIFTHKRAMLLDCLLESLIENFQNISYPINIIYHEDISHKKSYDILFQKYKNQIEVFKRENYKINKLYFIRPQNIMWYIKFSWMRSFYDNFKFLLDNILKNSNTEYTLLSTDDQIFYKKKNIHKKVFDILDTNPKLHSYRLNINEKFTDEHFIDDNYDIVKNNIGSEDKYLLWKPSSIKQQNLWSYRFNVDGTIYNCNQLYKLIKPFIYNMPTTLESIGLWESRFRGYFTTCLSDINRSLVGVQASNIQQVNNTPQANFDLELLKNLYLNNYTINYKYYDIDESKYIFIPKKIPLKKNGELFYLSEDGKLS